MKLAYCDCSSGISGDMFLAALVDAGLEVETLRRQLALLDLPDPYEVHVEETHKGVLRACRLQVDAPRASSLERHLDEILAMIEASRLSGRAKQASQSVFQVLGEAEARVHGVDLDQVHFHEVGAVDSIVDIVGAAIGLEALGIGQLYASPLPMGSGQVQTRHGLLPLPAPATLEILSRVQAPVFPSQVQVELVTPTGAAILAALGRFDQPQLVLQRVGIGAGQRDLPWPNVLRLMVGEESSLPGAAETVKGELVQMETNIDDMNPQAFGHVMNRLLAAGALDVYLTPIYMKKNRPATLLGVIARKSDEPRLARLILEETTTLGVRVHPITRYEADREVCTVLTEYGEVPLKRKILDGQVVQAAPEYGACARLADEHGVPFNTVYTAALRAYEKC